MLESSRPLSLLTLLYCGTGGVEEVDGFYGLLPREDKTITWHPLEATVAASEQQGNYYISDQLHRHLREAAWVMATRMIALTRCRGPAST